MPNDYLWLGRSYVAGVIPVDVIIMIAIFLLYYFIQRKTKLGLYLYAIGGDRIAARRAGVNDKRYMVFAFVNIGLLAGVAVIASSRFGAALPNQGLNFEMDVITAVVIGAPASSGA